jgi:hypothetical protein
MSEQERKRCERAAAPVARQLERFSGESLFELAHSPSFQKALRNAHETCTREGGEAADGFWRTRNRTIVRRCLQRAHASAPETIVFVFGVDHKYAIEDEVRRADGARVRPVERSFEPRSRRVPEAIVRR